MPNWCSNQITIYGDKKGLKQLKSIFNDMDKNNEKVFESLIGRSKPDLSKEEWEAGSWYNGNIDHFGCKWDVHYGSLNLEVDEDSITISPETAWSPPDMFCRELSKIYNVSVEILYSEPGSDFAGKSIFTPDDETTEDYTYREGLYVLDNESFWYEIQSDLEYGIEEEQTAEEFADGYPYVSESDRLEIISLFNEELEKSKTEL